MYVKSTTWERNTHNLFDYEASRALRKKVNKCQGDCEVGVSVVVIARTGPDIFIVKPSEVSPELEPICSVRYEDGKGRVTQGKYMVQEQDGQKAERVWKIVKYSGDKVSPAHSQDGMLLRKGDCIKLGRLEFLVRELSFKYLAEEGRPSQKLECHTESDIGAEEESIPHIEEEIVDVNQLEVAATPRILDTA